MLDIFNYLERDLLIIKKKTKFNFFKILEINRYLNFLHSVTYVDGKSRLSLGDRWYLDTVCFFIGEELN